MDSASTWVRILRTKVCCGLQDINNVRYGHKWPAPGSLRKESGVADVSVAGTGRPFASMALMIDYSLRQYETVNQNAGMLIRLASPTSM